VVPGVGRLHPHAPRPAIRAGPSPNAGVLVCAPSDTIAGLINDR